MLAESATTFLNVFSPKESPNYAVVLVAAVSLVVTSETPPAVASYIAILAFPTIVFFSAQSFLSETKLQDTPEVWDVFPRVIGITSGIVSAAVLIGDTDLVASEQSIALLGDSFVDIYSAVLMQTTLFFCWSVHSLVARLRGWPSIAKRNGKNFTEVSLILAVFLISSTLLGVDPNQTDTASIYFTFLFYAYWVTVLLLVYFMSLHALRRVWQRVIGMLSEKPAG